MCHFPRHWRKLNPCNNITPLFRCSLFRSLVYTVPQPEDNVHVPYCRPGNWSEPVLFIRCFTFYKLSFFSLTCGAKMQIFFYLSHMFFVAACFSFSHVFLGACMGFHFCFELEVVLRELWQVLYFIISYIPLKCAKPLVKLF